MCVCCRLIATLSGCDKAGFKELIHLLERIEDLAHVLLWSVKESEASSSSSATQQAHSSNPFGGGGGGGGGGGVGGGSDDDLPIALIELPRLNLVFEATRHSDGKRSGTRFYSREHPGHYIASVQGERMASLLRGLTHALLLRNDEGDHFVLLSALAKPCRLSDPLEPLASQMLIKRHSPPWLSNLPSIKHYLYAVHRSQSYLIEAHTQ